MTQGLVLLVPEELIAAPLKELNVLPVRNTGRRLPSFHVTSAEPLVKTMVPETAAGILLSV